MTKKSSTGGGLDYGTGRDNRLVDDSKGAAKQMAVRTGGSGVGSREDMWDLTEIEREGEARLGSGGEDHLEYVHRCRCV